MTFNSQALIDRFMRYARIDTQSADTDQQQFPSTSKQLNLSRLLIDELHAMGIADATLDEHGYVMATIPATIGGKAPVLGLLAHVDTSPDAPGANVRPQLIDYEGGDIVLNEQQGIVMRLADFPELARYQGQQLIVTDGTTLLGADDKAGVAAIMAAAEHLMQHPEIPHSTVRIGFTVDEEVGRGVDHFDVKRFGANYAYTIDGGALGEFEHANFNAAHATVQFAGRNIHPGYAKGKMLNAMQMAMDFHALLPASERPETTEGTQGFFHLTSLSGSVEHCTAHYIVRDHCATAFEQRKALMRTLAEQMAQRHGANTVQLELTDQYRNMGDLLPADSLPVRLALQAMRLAGVEPIVRPIRGGTDGARLTYMGLPCPNMFAGGENFHSCFEYLPVPSLAKATEVILHLVSLYGQQTI